jgi:hypothetical protein
MHDAARRVGGFLGDRELAFEVAIERHTIAEQVVDARRRLARQCQRDVLVDETSADRDRVGRMRFRSIAFADGGGDAALRPGAGGASVTGRGASFSAQNRPARPPPTMTTSSM